MRIGSLVLAALLALGGCGNNRRQPQSPHGIDAIVGVGTVVGLILVFVLVATNDE